MVKLYQKVQIVQFKLSLSNVKARRGAKRRSLYRLVCAQHGREVNGVEVPCRNTRT